eukprot:TRINITY_DN47604_c0_g1_i1.p1 TRINITY_DN47604_c0_g1~~TRINITY_DN47604_c0_g1_i1.p1  ORF type:complete len:204 (-),score=27.55 TRINITY_DN47604_c0_g1_i1:154-687(-)
MQSRPRSPSAWSGRSRSSSVAGSSRSQQPPRSASGSSLRSSLRSSRRSASSSALQSAGMGMFQHYGPEPGTAMWNREQARMTQAGIGSGIEYRSERPPPPPAYMAPPGPADVFPRRGAEMPGYTGYIPAKRPGNIYGGTFAASNLDAMRTALPVGSHSGVDLWHAPQPPTTMRAAGL